MSTMLDYDKIPREEILDSLFERDGDVCAHPDCDQILDRTAPEGPMLVTIDHWIPQYFGKANGWTIKEIWDLSNLKLMHRKCNARKGDLIPNEDGTLPPKPKSTFKFRREARAKRPEICDSCQAGRLLGQDEYCNACGHGANPGRYPKWRQMTPKECDHDLFYCVSCTVWFPEIRRTALDALLTGGEGYE